MDDFPRGTKRVPGASGVPSESGCVLRIAFQDTFDRGHRRVLLICSSKARVNSLASSINLSGSSSVEAS